MRALLLAVAAALVAGEERHVVYDRTSTPPMWHRLAVRIPLDKPMHILIAVKQQNLKALEEKFWAVADPKSKEWQQFMTVEEIGKMVKSKPADIKTVKEWLKTELSKNDKVTVTDDAIEVTTSVGVVEKLFQGTLDSFEHDNGHHMIYRFFGPHSVPESVFRAIDFVEGVSEFPTHRSSVMRNLKPRATGKTPLIVPQSLQKMYSIPAAPAAEETMVSQGPAEFTGEAAYNKTGLKTFFKDMDIAGQAVSDIVGPFVATYPGVESTLDIQYIMGVGQRQTDFYWTSDNWMYTWSQNFFNSKKVPDVVSISWGWAEDDQCDASVVGTNCSTLGIDSEQYVARVNVEFQKIGLRGVSLIVCTQDAGANGKTDMGCTGKKLHAAFPGSSPYVTAVGATMLTNPEFNLPNPPPACSEMGSTYACASGGTEVAVSFAGAGFTSGGGFSTYTPMPSYQKKAVEAYLNKSAKVLPPASYFKASNRAFPDVAANGDNYLINLGGGQWTPVGGTSASTPTFAGITSYLNDLSYKKTGKPLGFINPLLYQMYAEAPEAFTDITVGDNKCTEAGCAPTCEGFECAAGWDPVTGLGTPVADKMLSYVEKILNQRAQQEIVV